ncbi:MAG: hypothetical protein Q6K92_11785, partial [Thermostichus sp. DG_1_5_bins_95]
YQWLPFPAEWLPESTYWVGGSLRDACLQQMGIPGQAPRAGGADESIDLDLLLGGEVHQPVEWAAAVARRLRAGFVVLDAERQIARIVLPKVTLDIAQQMGSTPECDLWQRDFTCNALALHLQTGQLLDPTGGQLDIRRRQMRMVRPENLSADPLRLLRAYRQGAQLGFELETETQRAIQARADLLAAVAGERVRTEVVALLEAGSRGLDYLQAAVAAGLLRDWLPRLQLQKAGFSQAERVWQWAHPWQQQYPRTLAELAQPLADRRSGLLTVVLAALLWDPTQAAAPQAEAVAQDLERLRFSRAELRMVQKLYHLLPQLQELLLNSPTPVQQWRLYQQAGSLFGGLALLAVASGADGKKLEPWLRRYEDLADPLAHLVPLLDGKDLLHSLGAKPGPWVGQLLQALQEAQVCNQIQSRAEALAFAHRWHEQEQQNQPKR